MDEGLGIGVLNARLPTMPDIGAAVGLGVDSGLDVGFGVDSGLGATAACVGSGFEIPSLIPGMSLKATAEDEALSLSLSRKTKASARVTLELTRRVLSEYPFKTPLFRKNATASAYTLLSAGMSPASEYPSNADLSTFSGVFKILYIISKSWILVMFS
jgi:hypothetical protein